jgi:hypothetical protein
MLIADCRFGTASLIANDRALCTFCESRFGTKGHSDRNCRSRIPARAIAPERPNESHLRRNTRLSESNTASTLMLLPRERSWLSRSSKTGSRAALCLPPLSGIEPPAPKKSLPSKRLASASVPLTPATTEEFRSLYARTENGGDPIAEST